MIQTAKSAFSNCNNLSFEVQDAANLLLDKKFDLVTSFTVMQWVLDQAKALEGFAKVLKEGGKVCIQMPTGLPAAMEQALEATLAKDRWKPYFSEFSAPWRFYQPNEYRQLLINAKLTPTRLDVVTKHEYFPSRQVFHEFLKQWFPYLRSLPAHQKDFFLTDLLDNYLKILHVDDQGRVSFIVDRLEVEAIK
jgi:trans-aconitate methyltransferase